MKKIALLISLFSLPFLYGCEESEILSPQKLPTKKSAETERGTVTTPDDTGVD